MSHEAHVVIIDDEPEMCELLALRLEFHGYRVTTAQTVARGLELLDSELVDAMVVDLQLEQGSGMEVLAAVKARALEVPVIILTAHGSIESAVEAMARGAYGFLTKPFHDHELMEKLAHGVESARLKRELAGLRRLVDQESSGLVGTSEPIHRVREALARVAPTDATVLLLGESGTGKELAARTLHARSHRAGGPFVAVNCGALPGELLESELFGHLKGAFTGATRDKEGVFAAAKGGTLFLDEVGDAPPAVQVKLLRVLQEQRFTPVGATSEEAADVRVVAATNRDLRAEVAQGRFREDLFYRLHVVPVTMPPLRERKGDVPLLARLFLVRCAARHGIDPPALSREAMALLSAHAWPGNVRELANVMEGAALLTRREVLEADDVRSVLPAAAPAAPTPPRAPAEAPGWQHAPTVPLPPLKEARDAFARAYLLEALRRSDGVVAAAARLAGRNRTDFHDLLRRHGLSSSRAREE
ncbi:MAG: sigma-54 dependent transcriptional regulator [Archangium sp.]|nr:sigma-54 dependent transcriptional regulator [Archangium sp.]MDP3158275.1 sigma-54 dependent transcriptional regulator [Archangium sp.]MDP3569839.1 sigma-54 dependent transcriptional regulator [Archangium sp.]